MTPEMHYVDSSNVEAVGYDPTTQELVVQFLTSGTYVYFDVEEWIFNELPAGSLERAVSKCERQGSISVRTTLTGISPNPSVEGGEKMYQAAGSTVDFGCFVQRYRPIDWKAKSNRLDSQEVARVRSQRWPFSHHDVLDRGKTIGHRYLSADPALSPRV